MSMSIRFMRMCWWFIFFSNKHCSSFRNQSLSLDYIINSNGFKATTSRSADYIKEIVLKDVPGYGPWKAKLPSILNGGDCSEIVHETRVEPERTAPLNDENNALQNKAKVHINLAEMKCFRKRSKKVASLITQNKQQVPKKTYRHKFRCTPVKEAKQTNFPLYHILHVGQ